MNDRGQSSCFPSSDYIVEQTVTDCQAALARPVIFCEPHPWQGDATLSSLCDGPDVNVTDLSGAGNVLLRAPVMVGS